MIIPVLKFARIQDEKQAIWSNNNAESINSVIRNQVDHSPQSLDELVRDLKIIVEKQILEERASLHGVGSYSLVGIFRRYIVTNAK